MEVHEKETDVIYVIDGQATPRKLVKGDVIVVPAGVPHWFKEVPQPISYYVVKVIKP